MTSVTDSKVCIGCGSTFARNGRQKQLWRKLKHCSRECWKANLHRRDPVERFWQFVDKRGQEDCWTWSAARDEKGYGLFLATALGDRRTARAHRIAYRLAHNLPRLPSSCVVMHVCDNPPCCNPQHLKLGTVRENNDDKIRKGRAAAPLRGEANGHSLMTAAQVIAFRSAVEQGATITALSQANGLKYGAIWNAVHKRTWRHLA